jgi:hypothetical protein
VQERVDVGLADGAPGWLDVAFFSGQEVGVGGWH